MTLLEWPVELIEMVLANLHPLHVVKLRRVCRTFRNVIDSSNEIQLHLNLAEDGHLLKKEQKEPIFVLKERFNSHRRALNTFNPQQIFDATMKGFFTDRYDISDGIICRLMNSDNNPSISRIAYHELDRTKGEKGWEHVWETPMNIIDLSFWASNDIQILTEERESGECKRLHFLSISTNSPHAEAAVPYRDFRRSDVPVSDDSLTIMHEDKVAMVFTTDIGPSDGLVFVLDWKTGEMLLPYKSASDAAFAPNGYLLLARRTTEYDERPCFEVFSLPSKDHLYRCFLPFPGAIVGISVINNHNFDFPRNPFISNPREFIPDPALNIIGARVEWELGVRDVETRTVVISVKSLLDICSKTEPNQTLEWEEWGPRSTRWLPPSFEAAGDICIFGSRMVACEVTDTDAGIDVSILDFNPHNLQKDKTIRGAKSVFDSASKYTFNPEGYETYEVTSSLPYRKLITKDFSFYNVDLDGMILVVRDETGENDMSIMKLCPPDDES